MFKNRETDPLTIANTVPEDTIVFRERRDGVRREENRTQLFILVRSCSINGQKINKGTIDKRQKKIWTFCNVLLTMCNKLAIHAPFTSVWTRIYMKKKICWSKKLKLSTLRERYMHAFSYNGLVRIDHLAVVLSWPCQHHLFTPDRGRLAFWWRNWTSISRDSGKRSFLKGTVRRHAANRKKGEAIFWRMSGFNGRVTGT